MCNDTGQGWWKGLLGSSGCIASYFFLKKHLCSRCKLGSKGKENESNRNNQRGKKKSSIPTWWCMHGMSKKVWKEFSLSSYSIQER